MPTSAAGGERLPPALIYRNTDERPGPADVLDDNPMRWLVPLVVLAFATFGAVAYFMIAGSP